MISGVSVDEPWQFLSFCFEWNDFINHGETSDFITHLPCYSDCSNSGLQIYSGLLADERGGKATNLTGDKPEEIYTKKLQMKQKSTKRKTRYHRERYATDYGINRYTTKKTYHVCCIWFN